jgi:leucyl aminopeptidase
MPVDIKVSESKDKHSLELVPFHEDKSIKSKMVSHLKAGEWLLIESENQKIIYFKIDTDWNDQEYSEKFRSFAAGTLKFWGSKPLLRFQPESKGIVPSLRGIILSNYDLGFYKQDKPKAKNVKVLAEGVTAHEIERAKIEAEAQMTTMSLVDLPPNEKTPEKLGVLARKSARKFGFECVVWNDGHIIAAGLNALHSVGRGSVHDPVFILSTYKGRKDDNHVDIALVGKGITFDTGGISIKPSTNMHYMKSDMAGAAAMLGVIEIAARLNLPVNITAIVPSAENSPGSNALLPGEVIKSYSGKTIEVIDTDAEGRLVLADGLSWAVRNLNPKIIVDMATLTGSSVRALGSEAAALYTENDELLRAFRDSGVQTGEQVWHMPLWKAYDHYIHSDIADVSNLPSTPLAGSIAAAKFLQVFTDDHPSWVHIDMPGMSFKDSPHHKTKSATGYGLFLLTNVIEQYISNPESFSS